MIKVNELGKAIIPKHGLLSDAIKALTESALRIVLIVDSDMKLLGTVTDGDIRRGLLRGLNLTSSISEIINPKPIIVPISFTRDRVLQIMLQSKVYQIPVVDDESVLVGLHLRDEERAIESRSNLMVIMAGGRGTRLLPRTETIPKPMLTVAGKPILEHIIERAKAEGILHFILSVHYLAEVIQNYFGDGKAFGVNISYIIEKTPLGTAGALGLIDPEPLEPIVVTNGDVLTDIKYGELIDFHTENAAEATMAVHVYQSSIPYGVVRTKDLEITGYTEKPVAQFLINAGVYVLSPQALKLIDKFTATDMPNLFSSIQKCEKKVIAYPVHEKWIDIGTKESFNEALYSFKETSEESN